MKKVAAFMYGNSVRLSDALACYNPCNDRDQTRVESELKARYDAWDRDEISRHKAHYYSISMKYQAWINGKSREQYVAVKPVVSVNEIGPPGTRYFEKLASTIKSISSVE